MARLIIALIRHGDYQQLADTPSAHQPFALSEQGMAQSRRAAQSMAQTLQSHNWQLADRIHSSNLLRAWQTGNIISQHFNATRLLGHDALAERCLGSAANLTLTQIEAIIEQDPRFESLPANWKSNSHFRLPLQGAESLLEAGQRVANTLQQLAEQQPALTQDTLLPVVGHGAAFRHAAYHLGLLSLQQVARLSMYHAQPVYLSYNAGRWQHINGEWKLRRPQDRNID